MDAAYNVVYDSHNTHFKSVYFWNSIVKMTVANKPFYSTKSKGPTQQSIRLENNVFYAGNAFAELPMINCGDRSQAFQTTGFRW